MNKKTQAATEFLTTYGWILLAVLVTIGALIYFGLLSPSMLLTENCEVSHQIICEDWHLTGSEMHLMLRNGFPRAINITAVDSPISLSCNSPTIPAGNATELSCSGDFSGYDKNPLNLIIFYTRADGTVEHNTSARLVSRLG